MGLADDWFKSGALVDRRKHNRRASDSIVTLLHELMNKVERLELASMVLQQELAKLRPDTLHEQPQVDIGWLKGEPWKS